MSAYDPYDRERENLENMYERGEMNREEFNRAIRDLERDAYDEARERAQEAYDKEIDRW